MHTAQSAPDMLCAMVRTERPAQGLGRAIEAVARECNLTARRVRAIWHAEARRLWDDERRQIQAAFDARLARRVAQLDAEAALLRARIAQARTQDAQQDDGVLCAVAAGAVAPPVDFFAGPR